MNSLTKNSLLIAAVPATALVATLLVPATAHAADTLTPRGNCPGSIVGTYPVGNTAQMQVWYSPANGGSNCIKTVSTNGKTSERYLRVWATAVGTSQNNSDEGFYRHYAGPLTLTGTAGTCISATAKASPGRKQAGAVSHSIDNKHCG